MIILFINNVALGKLRADFWVSPVNTLLVYYNDLSIILFALSTMEASNEAR